MLTSVALRKESVDRNLLRKITVTVDDVVALRKESVDRNPASGWRLTACLVALRKESVDRNCEGVFLLRKITGRSPQGERG